MKILFVAGNYSPVASAGALVLEKVCAEFKKMGHQPVVYSTTTTKTGYSCQTIDEILVHSGAPFSYPRDLLLRAAVWNRYHSPYKGWAILQYEKAKAWHSKKTLANIIAQEKPDLVISVCYPIHTHMMCATLQKKYRFQWYAYYLDVFYNNPQYPVRADERKKLKKYEFRLLDKATRILMPSYMMGDYAHWATSPKMTNVEYPFVSPLNKSPESIRDAVAINAVYLGTLYESIRSPAGMLGFFKKLSGQIKVQLTCVGKQMGFPEGYFEQWQAGGALKVAMLPPVPHEQTHSYIEGADILVNIGNTHPNQLPSKIFEYIGSGKPILHFYKIPDCPAKMVLERYPLAFCVDDTSPVTGQTVADFLTFCVQALGRRLCADEIVALFPRHALPHVAQTILQDEMPQNN